MKRKLNMIVSGALAAALLFSSCTAQTPKNDAQPTAGASTATTTATTTVPAAEAKPAEPVTMRITWWGSQTRHDRTQAVLKEYEKLFPNIKFSYEFSAWSGYWEKLSAQAAASNLPDIFQQDYQYLNQYANKNLITPLDAFVGKEIDLSDVSENAWGSGTLDGKLYAINLGMNTNAVAYDPELFAQAGIEEPKPDWTYDDYKKTVLALHEKLNIFGDGQIPGGMKTGFGIYVRQYNEDFFNPEGTGLGYSSDQMLADFFQMELDLINAGAIPSPSIRVEIKSPENELIVTKAAAMLSSPLSNQIESMAKAANRPIKLAYLPSSPDKKRYGTFLKPSQFFSISTNSKYQAEAAKFLNYFTNDIEANKILMAERGVPIAGKVREALMPLLDDTQKEIFKFVEGAEAYTGAIYPPEPAQSPEIDKLMTNIEAEVMFGKISPLDAAKKFRTEAEKIFANAK